MEGRTTENNIFLEGLYISHFREAGEADLKKKRQKGTLK